MLAVYRDTIVGAVPAFPALMEAGITGPPGGARFPAAEPPSSRAADVAAGTVASVVQRAASARVAR